jgi:exodeoxyribonuclease-3
MRIATWNINGLRARLEFMKLWLEARQPDVVGLQELKITDEEFPTEFFNALGYHVCTHGQKAWNGVAILSRAPVEVLERGLPGQAEFGSRFMRVRAGDVEVTTVYCPNGKHVEHEDYARKLGWFDSLRAHWAGLDASACSVLCGDFNVVPMPLDSWLGEKGAGHIFHTDAERSRFAALLELGLFDLYRQVHPDEKAFSWWDYRGGAFHRGHGLRIDLLLGSAATRARLRDAVIDREFRKKQNELTASDHAPVFVDLADVD